ncbi:thiol-disulfide isomerase/thioredoxin [Rhodopseudomonas thermotolerans]|uniref:Thiol-disulfide isomerase/thioredoxin n=3 Tax=Nitrobacteraceae TaxID=41294 RepID=A0A336JZ76_9BRAD|nr:thiol-disulfide isomerase/thioredoxin [Rhodopseudomonas pentothenatexigens]REF88626.1 thiol-disulfide isomerase/thioredoxin [Rhodopseudomonas thermotolerans]SSW93599.1 thiol-disulfide isomerase/thioredoxin [Rhodopseudomonas pentothenatexigens]
MSSMLTRKTLLRAVLAFALAALLPLLPAFANTAAPYSAAAFKAAQAAGGPVLVEIHADWCSTCKAQTPIIQRLAADPKFAKLKIFRVDFDGQKDVVKAFGASMQSTLIVFNGTNETGRSVGDTKEASIASLLAKAL